MCSVRGAVTSTTGRQEVSRAAAGTASDDAAARTPAVSTTSQPAQATQPAAQPAAPPQPKLDEKLFTLGATLSPLFQSRKGVTAWHCTLCWHSQHSAQCKLHVNWQSVKLLQPLSQQMPDTEVSAHLICTPALPRSATLSPCYLLFALKLLLRSQSVVPACFKSEDMQHRQRSCCNDITYKSTKSTVRVHPNIHMCVCADDLSSEDGGSPTAVKGLADLKVTDSSQNASKRPG